MVSCLLNTGIFFLHMLNYSCANSDLFNRIHWLLVSHNITSLYLLSNKYVIRAIYINFFILFIYAVIFFYRGKGNCLGCLNGSYATGYLQTRFVEDNLMDICTKFDFNLQRGFEKDWNGKNTRMTANSCKTHTTLGDARLQLNMYSMINGPLMW